DPSLLTSAASIYGLFAFLLSGVSSTWAHNVRTSYARVTIQPNQVEFKLAYDISTLLKMAPLDRNGDGRLSREEFLAGSGQIESYLRRHVFPEINSYEVELGRLQPLVWSADAGEAIAQKDYKQRLLSLV